ncbi:hypothetical protein PVAND_015978 [Polypedilum vanderplanki]|uniref:Curlin associated repeat-containing protein n=1 Tax=Polypedilum vanderplanki TaxID=319348 RepID=A0A9J6BE52_POLVA|nr:hypothetical protein PVAND_015978 [Polypedilum vanderplanki]
MKLIFVNFLLTIFVCTYARPQFDNDMLANIMKMYAASFNTSATQSNKGTVDNIQKTKFDLDNAMVSQVNTNSISGFNTQITDFFANSAAGQFNNRASGIQTGKFHNGGKQDQINKDGTGKQVNIIMKGNATASQTNMNAEAEQFNAFMDYGGNVIQINSITGGNVQDNVFSKNGTVLEMNGK